MSSSAPEVTAPVTFPERFAWLQHTIKTRIKPYHFAVATIVALITGGFLTVIAVVVLIATNFNVLGWME